jgi:hypothetical protein
MIDEKAPVTEAPEKSAREVVNESLLPPEPTDESSVETVEKSTEEVEISDEAKAFAEEAVMEGKEKGEEENEVDAMLKEPESSEEKVTPHAQKRIDRLVGEKKALEARLEKLEKAETTKGDKPTKYTDAQLRVALKKAMEDGDSDLVWDIMDYKSKQVKEDLTDAYTKEQQRISEQAQAINGEWNQTMSAYDKYADAKIPAIYPNSQKDLNLRDASSLLYQVAMALYSSNDPEKVAYYHKAGGQRLAVADALTTILSKKVGRTVDSEKSLLKKQLLKEKRKKNVPGGGSSGEEEALPKSMTDEDILASVISERKKYQNERGR